MPVLPHTALLVPVAHGESIRNAYDTGARQHGRIVKLVLDVDLEVISLVRVSSVNNAFSLGWIGCTL